MGKVDFAKRMKRETIVQVVQDFVSNHSKDEIVTYNFRNERKDAFLIDGIKGFKEYKMNYEENKNFDADSSDLTMSIWCILLEHSQHVETVLGYEGRTIIFLDKDGKKGIVETDTINSFSTPFNAFFRDVMKSRFGNTWYHYYREGYGLKNGELIKGLFSEDKVAIMPMNRDQWMLDYYEELFNQDVLTKEQIDILQAYESFANWTHTIGNFMIGPKGFNWRKNETSNDRLDVFLNNVGKHPEFAGWKKEFTTYMDVNFLGVYFEAGKFTNWEKSKLKNLRNGSEVEWIKQINEIIEKRGTAIADRLIEIAKNL